MTIGPLGRCCSLRTGASGGSDVLTVAFVKKHTTMACKREYMMSFGSRGILRVHIKRILTVLLDFEI
jgi:hypothetical protein